MQWPDQGANSVCCHLLQRPGASTRQQIEPEEEGNHVHSYEEAYDVAIAKENVLLYSLATAGSWLEPEYRH